MLNESRILRWLYFAGVIAIPFDGIPGPGVCGELAHEASFLFFFPALGYASLLVLGGTLAGSSTIGGGSRWGLWCGAALLCCVALSGIVNLPAMASATFHDRVGLPKFVTSIFVIAYAIGLAWLTTRVIAGDWYRRLVVPGCISVAICLVVCLFESASLHGVRIAPFETFYTLIHSGSDGSGVLWDGSLNLKLLEGWDKRMRSVSFEPPAFGTFAGLIWPWLVCGVAMSQGRRRAIHAALLTAFTALIILAKARTGWLLLACDIGALAALRFVFLPPDGRPGPRRMMWTSAAAITAVLAAGTYYFLSYDALVESVVQGDSVSDLTRSAYQVTAYRMFFSSPVFGVGLGQFAFSAAEFMPNWGFLSAEIRPSLIFPDAPWPSTYSIYARIAAELGSIGLITWIGIWTTTIYRVRKAALAEAGFGVHIDVRYYVVIMAIAGIFASGVTDDSFRKPLIWITLGAATGLIRPRRGSGSEQGRERRIDS